MSWTVVNVYNTTEFAEQCALELNDLANERGDDPYAVENADGTWTLSFNDDQSEHIDTNLYDDEVQEILARHKVNGEARFATVDNGCSMWEHVFEDGEYSFYEIDLADVEFNIEE